MRLETLAELKFVDSSFSSSNISSLVFRAYHFIETRQTLPSRPIRGKSSVTRQKYLSQQYPPPLLRVRRRRRCESGFNMRVWLQHVFRDRLQNARESARCANPNLSELQPLPEGIWLKANVLSGEGRAPRTRENPQGRWFKRSFRGKLTRKAAVRHILLLSRKIGQSYLY